MECYDLAQPRDIGAPKEETKVKEVDHRELAGYANSPLAASPPVCPFSQAHVKSGAFTIPNFEGPQPFWEPDYPSQRFRPDEDEGCSDDVCYSPPPQLFSAPASPSEMNLQHTSPGTTPPAGPFVDLKSMASSPNDTGKETKPTSFVPVYKGLTFTPRSNLTAYGTFADRSKLQDASLGGVYTLMNSTEDASHELGKPSVNDFKASTSIAMVRKASRQTEGEESHFSSEAEIHSCAGVPVGAYDDNIPTMGEHQKKSFEELETERGIIEWNNTVFDERWLDPSPLNVKKLNSARQPTSSGTITDEQNKHASAERQGYSTFFQALESTRKKMDLSARFKPDPLIWGQGNKTPPPEKDVHGEQARELLPEPPWPSRLQEVVRDLEGGTGELPHGITHRPAVLRRFFYDRVFLEGWEWVGSDEQRLTKNGGRVCSVGAVRDQALKDIEDLVSFMTAPVGQGIRTMTFPRTPEAADMREEDPFDGNAAGPWKEPPMRGSRRQEGDEDTPSLPRNDRSTAMARSIGHQPGSLATAGLVVPPERQNAASIALAQHISDQGLTSVDTRDAGQTEGELTQQQKPNRDKNLDSNVRLDSQSQQAIPSGNLGANENPGANGPEGRHLGEYVPASHITQVRFSSANTDESSLRKHQLDFIRAASEYRSLSHDNRSSSQVTLTANNTDVMRPNPCDLMDNQNRRSDSIFADHRQAHGLLHADWENYVPSSSVMGSTGVPLSPTMPTRPPPSTMHPGYGDQRSEAAPQQIQFVDYDRSAYDRPQQATQRAPWEEVYHQQPTGISQQPHRSVNQQFSYARLDQTARNSSPSHPYGAPLSTQYGAQPMQYGFPQQAAGYAGSSTTDTGSSTAFEPPASRYTYINPGMMNQPIHLYRHDSSPPLSYHNVGVRAPAPNRFAAVLARSKDFESYGIPQARGTHQHRTREESYPSQAFVQSQVRGFPVPNVAHVQTRYGGTPIPHQAYIPNRVRGTPAPNEIHLRNQSGQATVPSQVLPQYPIGGTTAPSQSLPDSHISSARTPTQTIQNSHEWQSRFGIPQEMVKPDLPILHYRDGSDDMCPHHTKGMPTIAYQNLFRNLRPGYETLRDPKHLPFTETARDTEPVEWGVLKIGNIPYDINKDLVTAFLGNHAKLITANLGPAIHIIMDRVSGKTMDCFVEFLSPPDARATCNSINLRQRGLIRISDRVVDVNMSSQNELLATLFPKAKDVKWVNGKPIVMQPEEEWSSGFKSFVSAEELGLLVKHAEQPHRSNYTQRSPQRCYESMISLLAKFPWQSVDNYTLCHRNQIFNATRQMLHILSINLRKQYGRDSHSRAGSGLSYTSAISHGSSDQRPGSDRYGGGAAAYGGGMGINPGSKSADSLTEDLLKDLLSAALNAAGFSENQRWQLYEACEYAKHHFIVSPILQHWPFQVLGRKVRVEEDVLEFYAQIIASNPEVEQTGFPFGSFLKFTGRLDLESQTVDKVGTMELTMLGALLEGGIENAMAHLQTENAMAALTL